MNKESAENRIDINFGPQISTFFKNDKKISMLCGSENQIRSSDIGCFTIAEKLSGNYRFCLYIMGVLNVIFKY